MEGHAFFVVPEKVDGEPPGRIQYEEHERCESVELLVALEI